MVLGVYRETGGRERDAVSRGWHFENEGREHAVLQVTSRKIWTPSSTNEARSSEFRL